MKSLRLLAAVCALTAVGVLAFASTGVAARPASAQAAAVPISTTDPTGTFTGTFTITRFIAQNGQVAATPVLHYGESHGLEIAREGAVVIAPHEHEVRLASQSAEHVLDESLEPLR